MLSQKEKGEKTMLEMLYEKRYFKKERNDTIYVETIPLEHDYAIEYRYDFELYKLGKYGKTTISLIKVIKNDYGNHTSTLLESAVEHGTVVASTIKTLPMRDFTEQTRFGYNAFLEALERYNMMVRGLMITTAKDITV
jgi:hypothetical protein